MYEEVYRNSVEKQDTINMISESITSKEEHLQFFQWLINSVRISELSPIPFLPLSQAKQVIINLEYIRDEELKHLRLLIDLYHRLTGSYPLLFEGVFHPPENLDAGLKNLLMENLESVNKYRFIMNDLTYPHDKDMISNIISDVLQHMNLYNTLLIMFHNIKQIE